MRGIKRSLLVKRLHVSFIAIGLFLYILSYSSRSEALSIYFTNYNIIDFGSVDLSGGATIIDDIPYDGLVIRCNAGPATPGWTLNVKIEQPLTHESNPAATIPNTYFKWYVEKTTGNRDNVAYGINQPEEFTTYDKLVYTGTAGEDETDLKLKFQLELSPNLQWGTYSTRSGRIVFTLTE